MHPKKLRLMKPRLPILLFLFLIPAVLIAQKNVVPADQISSLDLKLPDGSRQDKRFLSKTAAAALLQTEVNDQGITLGEVEVYLLPPNSKSGFDGDVLVENLEKSGFKIFPTEDQKMAWVIREESCFLIYFSTDNEETGFYLARSNSTPKSINQAIQAQQLPPPVGNLVIPSHIPPLPPARSPTRN
jgi:hypothetical protein